MKVKLPFLIVVLTFLFSLFGCRKITRHPEKKPLSPPPLGKTFGEIHYGGLATVWIEYKELNLLIDPCFVARGTSLGVYKPPLEGTAADNRVRRTMSSALNFSTLPPMDYLLITDDQPHHLGPIVTPSFRKKIKVLSTESGAKVLKSAGFTSVKVLRPGRKIMLRKDDGFLFVRSFSARNPVSGKSVNGYLLEFDNGRNVLITGEVVDRAALREFVYGLRDDGLEVHVALVYSGGIKTKEDKTLQSSNEILAAEIVALLQPKMAFLLETEGLNVTRAHENIFLKALEDQIFDGSARFAHPGDNIQF